MNTELATIFTDETAEFNNLQSGTPSIDLTDWELPNSLLGPIGSSPNFLITAAQGSIGYYEIEFHQGNSQWGCGFQFGTSSCGVQIRQGIAHMIDKNSFTSNEGAIAGHAAPIDNPLPTTIGGGLPTPNPCGYDASFAQSGTQCIVGANGGVSYHLGASAGADGFPWLQAPGSADLNAAAQHFVNAGVATGFSPTTSVLSGISSAAASNAPNLFIRNDNVPRFDLGHSLAAQICYLFTGLYTQPCTYLSTVEGPITAFLGFTTSRTTVNLNWNMYTAAFGGGTFYDASLYFGYNSRFVSGVSSIQAPAGPCDANSVPTASAGDYQYVCDPTYDSLSTQMETAPCQTATGDPAIGSSSNLPTSPGNGICPGTTATLSSISAGIQAQAEFGSKVLTLPVFETTVQYGYLNNGWSRISNNSQFGISNFFTWLNAWNGAPVVSQTLRQGFKETTKSTSPYIGSTIWDLFIYGNVYDSLYASNPLAPSQLINWMTISTFQETNSSLGYTAPAHTLTTYRFTLRPDLYFQDGTQVTAYDIAFSYLSLVGQGAFAGTGATSMTGITVLQPHQFDIGVNSLGPFTLASLTGLPIVPGRYWTGAGMSSWDTARNACTGSVACPKSQFSLSGANVNCALDCSHFSAALMSINPADTAATFDPISAHILVGSGPWTCGSVTTSGSGQCTVSGTQNPQAGSSYTLTRFGAGVTNCQQSTCYFRSSSTLATYIWSEAGSFLTYQQVAACFGLPVNLSGSCGHFQQGIGNPGTGTSVGLNQVTIANRFYLLNWLAPFDWATNPPLAIGTLPPILYEGPTTLTPASPGSCPAVGYDC